MPGDVRPEYPHVEQARQILNDAEADLGEWQEQVPDIESSATHAGLPLEEQAREHYHSEPMQQQSE